MFLVFHRRQQTAPEETLIKAVKDDAFAKTEHSQQDTKTPRIKNMNSMGQLCALGPLWRSLAFSSRMEHDITRRHYYFTFRTLPVWLFHHDGIDGLEVR